MARRRANKGDYEARLQDLRFRLQHCLIIWQATPALYALPAEEKETLALALVRAFGARLWLGLNHQLSGIEQSQLAAWQAFSKHYHIPMVACSDVLMHDKQQKSLQDTLTAIRHNKSVMDLGAALASNAESYLKPIEQLRQLYSQSLIDEAQHIAEQCRFSLSELRYQYPQELVPDNLSPMHYLRQLVDAGAAKRWPTGIPQEAQKLVEKELALIEELHYEYYFLTVYDIVFFARQQDILCQGRGSAANSVVCYCLFITEIEPGQINVLFERFISKERNEPPDIDVDFEHQRREEIIQYIYRKYGRERAALAASVVTYRARSAVRDVGKALGLDAGLTDRLAKSLAWWDKKKDLQASIASVGLDPNDTLMRHFFALVHSIIGFPRHLSQHVGGFVITQEKISDLVPLENASMAERTVIQWDKDDLEAMGLMKVDVLALGMLTALKKALHTVARYEAHLSSLSAIPKEDPATYAMLSRGDSMGVFQVESRAQMSMLPRLRPKCFYDLVIQIAIVRPGPIQGDMVHPYLRRRDKLEPVTYDSPEIESVLKDTLGVPIFQEQAIRLAMVAAGFSGGQADQLRRAMASWGKNSNLLSFEDKFIQGMLNNGYSQDFAHRLFAQIKGFGSYGFPESHSASFALLCYSSSWLKCHHPAAFYCALLNSQPMGFYSPSQLIQDARRHDVKVLPVSINASLYECDIEQVTPGEWGIRLGFNRVKGLADDQAHSIVRQRAQGYVSLQDLSARANLSAHDLQLLASADALRELSGHRYQSRWRASGLNRMGPLFAAEGGSEPLVTHAPAIEQDVCLDYHTTGLSLRAHPLSLLRDRHPFSVCKTHAELASLEHGRLVKIVGLVTGRQRPGTAKGTVFVTLEDETGNTNVVVWKASQERYRQALLTSCLLLVKGRLEKQEGVVHVIAGQLIDCSGALQQLELKSRDFH